MEFKFDEAKTWLEDENGKQVAVLDHPEVRPGVVNLVHTEVDPSLGGQGIAGKTTQAVAEKSPHVAPGDMEPQPRQKEGSFWRLWL